MKFLTNFDTKMDEKELLLALEKYGDKNQAILTKRNPIYLSTSLVGILASFLVFFCLIAFSYFQYFKTNPIAFGTVCGLQLLITLFWIIHSLILIIHAMRKHSGVVYFNHMTEEELKPGAFEHYLTHSIFSMVFQFLLMVSNVVLAIILRANSFVQWVSVIGGIILNSMFLVIIYITIDKIIKYEMDFSVFTPESFTIYTQNGIFKSESTSISTSTVKMVKEIKVGFRGSLFGYGKLSIHPEGGANQSAPIFIEYVTRPKILLKKLNELIEASKDNRGNSTL